MIKSGINYFKLASKSTLCYRMTPQVLHQSVKTPMFMPYYMNFSTRPIIKPGNGSFIGETNKLGKLEDIENEFKNKMEL